MGAPAEYHFKLPTIALFNVKQEGDPVSGMWVVVVGDVVGVADRYMRIWGRWRKLIATRSPIAPISNAKAIRHLGDRTPRVGESCDNIGKKSMPNSILSR